MSFYYKDIKEIRTLVISHRNPAALTETRKESRSGAEQEKTQDPGSRRNPALPLGGLGVFVFLSHCCCSSRRSVVLPRSL